MTLSDEELKYGSRAILYVVVKNDRINFNKEYQLIIIDSNISGEIEKKLVEDIKNCMIKEINFEINYLDNMLIKDKSDLEQELEMLQSHNIKTQL